MKHRQALLQKIQFPQARRTFAAAAVLATGLLGVGLPAASAHTGALEAHGVCQDDGTRLVTYSGTTTNVPAGLEATVTVAGSSVTPSTQNVVGNSTFSFTQSIAGDASFAEATALLTWPGGHTSSPKGSATFTEDCTPEVVVPKKPDNLVHVKHWDKKDCDSREVTTTTKTTTTGWVLVDNTWVKDKPVVTKTDKTRPTTPEECPVVVPEEPEPLVDVKHWDDKDCDSREVTTTTKTTTTGWVLKHNTWVKDEPVVTKTYETRPTTPEECPVVEPPVDEPPVVEPPVVEPPVVEPPVVEPPVDDNQVIVLGVEAAVNPLPMGADAGQADSSGRMAAAGVVGSAAYLALGAALVLRRRRAEV